MGCLDLKVTQLLLIVAQIAYAVENYNAPLTIIRHFKRCWKLRCCLCDGVSCARSVFSCCFSRFLDELCVDEFGPCFRSGSRNSTFFSRR